MSPEEKAVSTEKKLKRPVYYVSIALDDPQRANDMPEPSSDDPPPQKKARVSHGDGSGSDSSTSTTKFTNVIATMAKKLFDNQNRATVISVHPTASEDDVNRVLAQLYDTILNHTYIIYRRLFNYR